MTRIFLSILLISAACGPKLPADGDTTAAETSGHHEDQQCIPCAIEVCDSLLDSCRNDPDCSCIAECVDEWGDAPVSEEDPFFTCADRCGKLEVPQWHDLSTCASDLCGMCPPSQG